MNTEQFIKDAIAGGWKKSWVTAEHDGAFIRYMERDGLHGAVMIERMFLDPLAWQSVGKTRGWKDKDVYEHDAAHDADWDRFMQPGWNYKMHRFIDHLADGDSIEEALGKL